MRLSWDAVEQQSTVLWTSWQDSNRKGLLQLSIQMKTIVQKILQRRWKRPS